MAWVSTFIFFFLKYLYIEKEILPLYRPVLFSLFSKDPTKLFQLYLTHYNASLFTELLEIISTEACLNLSFCKLEVLTQLLF